MSKNEDSAFAMVNLLESKIGQEVTIFLEGRRKFSNVTIVKAGAGEVVLQARKGKDLTRIIYTTPDRIVAFEDSEPNQQKKNEDEKEEGHDTESDNERPKEEDFADDNEDRPEIDEISPDDGSENPEDPEGK